MILGSHIHEAQSIAPAKEYSGQDDLVMWIDMKDSPVGFDSSSSLNWKIVNKVNKNQCFTLTENADHCYSHLKDRRSIVVNSEQTAYKTVTISDGQNFKIRDNDTLLNLSENASKCIGSVEMCGRYIYDATATTTRHLIAYGPASRSLSSTYISSDSKTLMLRSLGISLQVEPSDIKGNGFVDFYFYVTRNAKDSGVVKYGYSFDGVDISRGNTTSSSVPLIKDATSGVPYRFVLFGTSTLSTSYTNSNVTVGNMVYAYRWYNRVLTDEEILHNYNVDRIKYRLGMMD